MGAPDPEAQTAFVDAGCHLPPTRQGNLSGLAFAVKDNIAVAGTIAGCGNPDWAATHSPPCLSAPAIDRLRQAGAALTGKTIMDEFAYSLIGENIHYGTPPNPAAPAHVPGGSSSGSASAVAMGQVDFALGTDTAGSVRVPASNCGLFGFRPTHGAIEIAGVTPLAPSFDTVGLLAPTAEILRKVAGILLSDGQTNTKAGRLLIDRRGFEEVEADNDGLIFGEAIGRVTALGGWVEDVEAPPPCLDGLTLPFSAIQKHEAWAGFGRWLEWHSPNIASDIRDRLGSGAKIPQGDYHFAQAIRTKRIRETAAHLSGGNVLIRPTVPVVPIKLGASDAERGAYRERVLSHTVLASFAGLPEVTIPLPHVAGPPIGLSLIGAPGSDLCLLRLAGRLV